MLAELRTKSQITIPKELVTKLGLNEGDLFDVYEENGTICFVPVLVYPKAVLEELKQEIKEVKTQIKKGKKPVFDSVDDLFTKLEEN